MDDKNKDVNHVEPSAPNPKKIEELKAKAQEELSKKYTIEFMKGEWNFIYNVLAQLSYKIGDARVADRITDKIFRLTGQDSNTDKEVLTN